MSEGGRAPSEIEDIFLIDALMAQFGAYFFKSLIFSVIERFFVVNQCLSFR